VGTHGTAPMDNKKQGTDSSRELGSSSAYMRADEYDALLGRLRREKKRTDTRQAAERSERPCTRAGEYDARERALTTMMGGEK